MRARTWIAIVAVAAALGGGYALKEFNRAPEGAADMKAELSVTASELHAAFVADEAAATARYVGEKEQAIRVSGTIRGIDREGGSATVILETEDAMAGVVCDFAPGAVPSAWNEGDQVIVQGICTGINDLIPDVIMVRCAAME